MSGHSKWSTIKRKKGAADAKRGKIFTKLIKEITVAARMGGGDPDGNPRLRTAIAAGRAANMPRDNIDRAIKKGTGELEGVEYIETSYEGYGPGGSAVLVEVMTDNKNRTVSEVRHLFSKYNGNMGTDGCVAWMFDRVGVIEIESSAIDEEKLMDLAIESGAEDVKVDEDPYQVICGDTEVDQVAEAIRGAGVAVLSAAPQMIPQNTVKLEGKDAVTMLKLYEALEDNDDVQHVWSNFDIDDDVLEQAL